MASSNRNPAPSPAAGVGEESTPPGKTETLPTKAIYASAKLVQPMKPISQIKQHACSFALYGHDLSRQLEIDIFLSRRNNDFLQCAVYDSDKPSARLIGVEYIISAPLLERLPPEEQRLWHSHAYELKAGQWVHPRVPELIETKEVENLARTYGKFWCTWQVDRGDRLPMGAPALMMSPQGASAGKVRMELVKKRDERLGISSEELKESRVEISEPEWIHPNADYWKQHGKGFAVDVVPTEMKRIAPFP
ncbi:hypothetical protein HPP92_007775 [Vanilla planifolia]|uniref:Oil body-associated protein 2B n=1 Tax=Vanilla planifolia TaxID=51239 RepID=A0A835V677_VANPL|nr:hypothetical protein HPP92_007775 [Vanilla planifolia]